ncbi:bacterio-opsin activator domain-containing protein [Salinigranum salinum]|uniref:bacterio-opsin activator domain-containing protein n=1 Tax=Salinigranum salinum TaxID=1364937 RepID=UPI001260915C|nr:bacterio-opsin activator domain-containing protein [Salinigranum salinum]
MDDVLDHVSDGVLVVNADWHVADANAVAAAQLDRDVSTLVGVDVREVFPRSVESTFHGHFAGDDPVPAAVTFEDYFPDLGTWLEVRTVTVGDGLTIYLHDVTDRRGLERARRDSEAELGRLSRINATIQEIIRELVGATRRTEIEETVCERLVASDLYEFTWIGEREPLADRITHRVGAGEYREVVDLVVESGASPDTSECPEHAVIRTGQTRLVRQLVEDESLPDPIRRVAFARGLQSAIAVPVRYGTTTYGVLGVYATRPDAFSERERESLETLGVATGFVITAARQRNLLLSDTVVELTVRVTDPDDFLVAVASRLDCSLAVEGVVPLADGALLCYVSVEGAAPGDVREMAANRGDVDDPRVVNETSETESSVGGLLEITLTGASPLRSLTERGATVRAATFEDGVGRLVVELAPDEDVRAIVESLGEAFAGSELLAKRERQRSVETAQEFRSALHESLTDRQRTALRVAYHGGYFQSPRDSTAEELAARLGVSSPTLHYHLRAAQWKLVDAFLDERPGQERLGSTDDWRDDETGDG